MAVAGFHPADAEIRNQKAHHVLIAQARNEGCAVAVLTIAADIASGGNSLTLQTLSKSTQAHHQVLNNGSVLLS